MKLLRLKVNDEFRSLQPGFKINFSHETDVNSINDFSPYILAGPNGSGKSNILEIIAAIFYHIECIYLDTPPRSFEYDEDNNTNGFQAEKSSPNAFELEYLINVPEQYNSKRKKGFARILITKVISESPKIQWLNRSDFDEFDEEAIDLNRIEVKDFMPEYVLAYSSGENEILSLPFFKMRFIHYDEYIERLIDKKGYSGSPEGRLIYLDNTYSQAILLANYLVRDPEEESGDELAPFLDVLDIEDVKNFRIIIRKVVEFDQSTFDASLDASLLGDIIIDLSEDKTVPLQYDITNQIKSVITRLQSCATTVYEDYDDDLIYLDYWVNDETKKAFKLHFGQPLELFKSFQTLLSLNLYTVKSKLKQELYHSSSLYVNETVPVLASDERVMRFKHFEVKKRGIDKPVLLKMFSDGEHQFLHSLGLCLIYKDTNSLFLLDEPETHFNPDWRSKFISSLRDCFMFADNNAQHEILITTHSPFLISDSTSEKVLVFKKKNGVIEITPPGYNTLGASINKITMETFDKRETIGDYAKSKLIEFENRALEGEDVEELASEANKVLGDSVEKVLFINSLLMKKETE